MEYIGNGINILGKTYIEKPANRNVSKSFSKLMPFMMMAAQLGSLGSMYGVSTPRKRPTVNILIEFELIQQKKSKLSKSDRDWVECEFHKNFIEVK